jgi:hypothetical protein
LSALVLLFAYNTIGCGEDPGLGVMRQAATCENGGNVEPQTPAFPAQIDSYAKYVGQSTCDPTEKPGVVAFRDFVLSVYPCTGDSGITRGCSVGGKSEHKEGRAWDWQIQYPHPAADAFLGWLIKPDSHGNTHAMARRMGIMYMIWNSKVWKAYQADKGWQPYSGASPHTDHVHFSFSWDGANKKTSFWTSQLPTQPPQADGGIEPPESDGGSGSTTNPPPPSNGGNGSDVDDGDIGGDPLVPPPPNSNTPPPPPGPPGPGLMGGCQLSHGGGGGTAGIPPVMLLLLGVALSAAWRTARRGGGPWRRLFP